MLCSKKKVRFSYAYKYSDLFLVEIGGVGEG